MRISDWSSDVCSSDLPVRIALRPDREHDILGVKDIALRGLDRKVALLARHFDDIGAIGDAHLVVRGILVPIAEDIFARALGKAAVGAEVEPLGRRSEEHTSELQSLMRSSYAVFCSKKK